MKSDRELLDLAAKAAGIDCHVDMLDGIKKLISNDNGAVWNPLFSDVQAFRLAVKLRLVVDVTPWAADAHHWHDKRSDDYGIRHSDYDDPYAATRRAIVRAAAAIGEQIK